MTVSIYQIQYDDAVIGTYDPAFLKYDCRENPENEKREIAHMQNFFNQVILNKSNEEYFGLVSPKFNEKSKLSGDEFINWINDNPGYDVYFINPFPHLSYLHFNIWQQGEFWHPGLIEKADFLFKHAGFDIKTESLPRNSKKTLLYSNYWVGNKRFWKAFMHFIGVLTATLGSLRLEDRQQFFSDAPHYSQATYYPFIFERMFSTFLTFDESFKCLDYPYDKSAVLSRCTNSFEHLIVDDWFDLINKWDDESNPDLRNFFSNLKSMEKFLNAHPNTSIDSSACFLDRIKLIINSVLK